MFEFYGNNPRFHVGVDCIIFGIDNGKLSILLTRRHFQPQMGKWSLMGGFVQSGESVDDAAKRVLCQLTGLDNVFMEQVAAFGEVDRDPGERVVSIAYYALLGSEEFDPCRLQLHDAHWMAIDQLPELVFDHKLMINKAIQIMRSKLSSEPIGFNLLPKLFTLTQLQSLHEAILGEPIDKRNFRKRIADTPCIEKTNLIDKNGSRRGATLYRYNNRKFNNSFKI